jgi:hypothetical protein
VTENRIETIGPAVGQGDEMSRDRWICTECDQWFYAEEGDDPESNMCQRCQSGDTPASYIENHCS